MPVIEREVRTGAPIQASGVEITPQSRLLKIQFPGLNGGLIWNRPKAVIVRTANGEEYILPIKDVTRSVIWAMLAGGLFGAILIGLMRRTQ